MQAKTKSVRSGFTIVELLIVIVVIGVLAALVLTNFSQAQERAKVAKRESDLQTIFKSVMAARQATGKTLREITNNGWSIGACYASSGNPSAIEPRDLPKTHNCWQLYYSMLTTVGQAAGTNLEQLRSGDSRGNPYMFDENEGEQAGTPCRADVLRYFSGSNDATVDWKNIPFSLTNCI